MIEIYGIICIIKNIIVFWDCFRLLEGKDN